MCFFSVERALSGVTVVLAMPVLVVVVMVIALRKRFLFEVRLRWEAVGCVPDDETEKRRCHERGGSSDSSRPIVIISRAGNVGVSLAGIVQLL